MDRSVKKAFEIKDAKISFVSLVDKAANKRQFLITKAEDGMVNWEATGKIIKADSHYVTGVVYEPLVEDSQGDFMTAEEIQKACYWFAKHGDAVDIQHNFEKADGISVVENWIAKSDFEIDGEKITKGTWLITAEVSDSDIWDKITKGEITGFSMGGSGKCSEENIDLDSLSKSDKPEDKQGLLSKLAKVLGFKAVVKGEVAEIFEERSKRDLFWGAVNALESCLYHYDWHEEKTTYEDDEIKLRECLSDFCGIVTNLLTTEKLLAKAIAPDFSALEKAGKKMSGKNKETLSSIYNNLGDFLKEFDEPEEPAKENPDEDNANENNEEEEEEVNKEELRQLIAEEIAKSIGGKSDEPKPEPETVEKAEVLTTALIAETVRAELAKALNPEKKEETLTTDVVKQIIVDEIAKAVEPIRKQAGLPSNLNSDKPVEKQEDSHYLHGLL